MAAMSALERAARSPSVARLCRVTSSAAGLDQVFRCIVYTLTLTGASLARNDPKNHLVVLLSRIVSAISDARITMRILGTIPSIQYLFTPQYNTMPLLLAQNLSMMVYYPAELVYWLGVHKIVDMTSATANRWSRVSCMGWAVWIALEIIRMLPLLLNNIRERRKMRIKVAAAQSPLKTDHAEYLEKEGKAKQSKLDEEHIELRMMLLSQMADMVLAVHWSLPSYPLTNWWVGVVGVVGSIGPSVAKWKRAAS